MSGQNMLGRIIASSLLLLIGSFTMPGLADCLDEDNPHCYGQFTSRISQHSQSGHDKQSDRYLSGSVFGFYGYPAGEIACRVEECKSLSKMVAAAIRQGRPIELQVQVDQFPGDRALVAPRTATIAIVSVLRELMDSNHIVLQNFETNSLRGNKQTALLRLAEFLSVGGISIVGIFNALESNRIRFRLIYGQSNFNSGKGHRGIRVEFERISYD
ncbi:MAG: hypothetical protein AAF423_01285 [Pseudomonadota bacterium]